jgi:hypothetical protein
MILASAGDTSESFGSPARSQSRSNKLLLDLVILCSVIALTPEWNLAAFAKEVIDRLRHKIANPAIFIGTNLFDELYLVWQEIDRRAHQVFAGSLWTLVAWRTENP